MRDGRERGGADEVGWMLCVRRSTFVRCWLASSLQII